MNITLHVYIHPCYTAKTVVKVFFPLPLGARPLDLLWLRLYAQNRAASASPEAVVEGDLIYSFTLGDVCGREYRTKYTQLDDSGGGNGVYRRDKNT